MAVPTMQNRVEARKTGRLPNLRENAQTKGPEAPATRRFEPDVRTTEVISVFSFLAIDAYEAFSSGP